MAYLILNEKGPGTEGMGESWYEFDPNDEATLGKIEKLLSGRNSKSNEAREELAGLCERSFEEKSADVRKATFMGWLRILRNWVTKEGEKSDNANDRHHRSHKGFSHRHHLPGNKGKLSFV